MVYEGPLLARQSRAVCRLLSATDLIASGSTAKTGVALSHHQQARHRGALLGPGRGRRSSRSSKPGRRNAAAHMRRAVGVAQRSLQPHAGLVMGFDREGEQPPGASTRGDGQRDRRRSLQ